MHGSDETARQCVPPDTGRKFRPAEAARSRLGSLSTGVFGVGGVVGTDPPGTLDARPSLRPGETAYLDLSFLADLDLSGDFDDRGAEETPGPRDSRQDGPRPILSRSSRRGSPHWRSSGHPWREREAEMVKLGRPRQSLSGADIEVFETNMGAPVPELSGVAATLRRIGQSS